MSKSVACGILIAVDDEFERLKSHFTLTEESRVKGKPLFHSFLFADSTGQEQTAIVRFFQSMGPSDARNATNQLVDRYAPQVVISLGVSGALADYVCLGDIVIANETDEPGFRGKGDKGPTAESYKISFGGRTFHPAKAWVDILAGFGQSPSKRFEFWQQECVRQFPKGIDREALLKGSILSDRPKIHVGPVASGDTVGASTAYKKMLKERNRNFLALDMESSGVMQASEEQQVPGVVIRVISDLADENKQKLEDNSKYAIRNWASDNAFRLLGTMLREVFEFSPGVKPAGAKKAPRKGKGAARSRTGDLESKFHELAVQKYLKEPHKAFAPKHLAEFGPYDNIFRQVARVSRQENLLAGNLFESLAKYLVGSREPYALRIEGQPGSGKTSFLATLYHCLRVYRASSPTPYIPVYIDLKIYQEPATEEQQLEALRNDLGMIKSLRPGETDVKLIFLVDGIEEYSPAGAHLETELFQIIEGVPERRQVVGVGLNFHYADAFRRDDLVLYEQPEESVTLGGLSVDDPRFDSFLEAGLKLAPPAASKHSKEELLEAIGRFRLESLDVHTLWLMLLNRNKRSFKKAQTLSAFYRECCIQFLGKDTAKAAELAYRYSLQQSTDAQQELMADPASWRLIHRHTAIRDFLIATHAIHLIQRPVQPELLDEMSYVLPQAISRFSKEILNETEKSQAAVLDVTEEALRLGHHSSLLWLCYLSGRVASPRLKQRAKQVLDDCLKWVLKTLADPHGETEVEVLLIARTVYLSLVSLGSEDASNEYIDRMFRNPQWDILNRAFHLEYYGDVAYNPRLELGHSDPLVEFPNTFHSLHTRLSRYMNDSAGYAARDVDLYTLLSLTQHRHAEGRLSESDRVAVLKLITGYLASDEAKLESETLQRYTEMMRRNLEYRSFSIGGIAEQLYNIKIEKRRGWLVRGLDAVESVADHTFGAYLLGLIYLPESAPLIEDYDKREILDMLLIHDLGEAIVGDLLPAQKNEVERKKEREAYEYIGTLGTYAGVGNLERIKILWEKFEQKMSINARVANDIDKLENLMQLNVYQRAGRVVKQANQWQKDLAGEVETAIGRNILDVIRKQFAAPR